MRTADELRHAWTRYFVERGHAPVPSAGLIPHHPAAPLFTNAGMAQFFPYFLGEEHPPYPRATSVQKCVRITGKHDDIENIGRSARHLTFFEMLGNFSFGDYFKAGAITFAWELITEGFGFDPDLIWVTIHESDDEAEGLWQVLTPVPKARIQRLGDDNFWQAGDTGPCGPCSEIFLDRGPRYGSDGGPAVDDERFLEFWNLVFMQYDRQPDGSMPPLPKQHIDTGAGYERLLSLLQGVDTVFETDLFVPLLDAAQSVTGVALGRDDESDVSLRILADHARSMSFLINDGVFPSNEERGYVLRRLIRRAVRRAFSLGVEKQVGVAMVDAVVERMGAAYPDLVRNHDFIRTVVDREEGSFRSTLKRGMTMLDATVALGATVPGAVAFELHDTFGFPVEVTREVAAEHDLEVDEAGFRALMDEQRTRARAARRTGGGGADDENGERYRELLDQFGPTRFVGDTEHAAEARVLAVLPSGRDGHVEVVLDQTPFYAEGGGQVGDTGELRNDHVALMVVDTNRALPGLTRHLAIVDHGHIEPGGTVTASIDTERRRAIQRNHTGTHLLHAALRKVLGGHVKQQGSFVSPEHLRFDFSHFAAMTDDEVAIVERMVNTQVLGDHRVEVREMPKAEAEQLGAIAFFGEKYGATVRVLDAGPDSRELCGGTHVKGLGEIGPLKIVKEESVASNTRRIFATTGLVTLDRVREDEATLDRAAALLRTKPEELGTALEKLLAERKALQDELKAIKQQGLGAEAQRLVATVDAGAVVARVDGVEPDDLRTLAAQLRGLRPDLRAVVLIGSPDGTRVSLVASVPKGQLAGPLLAEAGPMVGGKAGGKEVAMGGGKDPSRIDDALADVRAKLGASGDQSAG